MAFEILSVSYGVKKILTDTGRILGNLLLNMELVNEISLLVHPLIVGEKCYPVFSDIHLSLPLKIKKSEQFENGCVWIVYNTNGDPFHK